MNNRIKLHPGFSFDERVPPRSKETELTANTVIDVPDPVVRVRERGRKLVLSILHKAIEKHKTKLRNHELNGGQPTTVDLSPSSSDSAERTK
jgi:hypothetical protein